MNKQEFEEQLRRTWVCAEKIPQVMCAYWLAKEMHRKQKRDGGERYFEHCRRVALLLLEWGTSDGDQLSAALLHDCIEDCYPPRDLLEKLFPKTVIDAIIVLSKVGPIFNSNGMIIEKKKKGADAYWQGIAASASWIRLIKLADRLDNLHSMGVWPKERKQKYIAETEKYIMPFARSTDTAIADKLNAAMNLHR